MANFFYRTSVEYDSQQDYLNSDLEIVANFKLLIEPILFNLFDQQFHLLLMFARFNFRANISTWDTFSGEFDQHSDFDPFCIEIRVSNSISISFQSHIFEPCFVPISNHNSNNHQIFAKFSLHFQLILSQCSVNVRQIFTKFSSNLCLGFVKF